MHAVIARAFWPFLVLLIVGWVVHTLNPQPSHISIMDWQGWAAIGVTIFVRYLMPSGTVEFAHSFAIFLAGVLVGRLFFW